MLGHDHSDEKSLDCPLLFFFHIESLIALYFGIRFIRILSNNSQGVRKFHYKSLTPIKENYIKIKGGLRK